MYELVNATEMLKKAKAGHYAVGPVSYTHLDVYKRQATDTCLSTNCLLW